MEENLLITLRELARVLRTFHVSWDNRIKIIIKYTFLWWTIPLQTLKAYHTITIFAFTSTDVDVMFIPNLCCGFSLWT